MSTGQKEDPELITRANAKHQEILQKKKENLTIAERLTRRALTKTIPVPFDMEGEQFEIEIRVPFRETMDKILDLQIGIQNAAEEGNVATVREYSKSLQHEIAALCTDDSITPEFLDSGAFLASDFGKLVSAIMYEEQRQVEANNSAASFRPER